MSASLGSGRVVLIGFGNMGQALGRGLLRAGVAPLYVLKRNSLQSETTPGLHVWTQENETDLISLKPWTSSDTIILCMKPQNLNDAAEQWGKVFFSEASKSYKEETSDSKESSSGPLLVSLLAGTTIENICEAFGDKQLSVVRAMPNIAATVDCSATALCKSSGTPENLLQRAKAIFDCVGKTWIVPEDLLDVVTGLSGSGPAYIYMIIEALSDGGVKMGMPRKLALQLATQTVLGAAKLVQETGEHPAVLRDQVTTPGGTTICAIHELERHGLRPMLISAVVTATRRSSKLARMKKTIAVK
jgi:pyrroline-5-carboxylate reductase